MTKLRALLVLSLALSSCASTSGHDWLNSPIDEQAEPIEVSVEEADGVEASPPRLSHVVTLGESYAQAPAPDAAAAPGSAPSVQVNVHTEVPVTINNIGGYGYGYGYSYAYGAQPIATPTRTTRNAAPHAGADFPPPPDYGPRALK